MLTYANYEIIIITGTIYEVNVLYIFIEVLQKEKVPVFYSP